MAISKTEQRYTDWKRGYRLGYSNERAAMAGKAERIPLPLTDKTPGVQSGFWDGREDAANHYGPRVESELPGNTA